MRQEVSDDVHRGQCSGRSRLGERLPLIMIRLQASAKTKEGVHVAFEELVEKIIQTPGLWEAQDRRAIRPGQGGDQEGQGACGGYCSTL